MKEVGALKMVIKIGSLCLLLIWAAGVRAGMPAKSDSPDVQNDNEKSALLEKITNEKNRIAKDYKGADTKFFNLADSVTAFILEQPVTPEKRNLYLSRLLSFLSNINRYYSDSYFKSGTYLAALGYYPSMIEWDEKDELGDDLKIYSAFSIKATRLIPGDAVAEDYLVTYMLDHPDDIFRYSEEFEDRKFALHLLERAVKLAPESAKRYYATENTVSNILSKSHDLFVRKSVELYSHFGIKSHSFALLDEVVQNNMPLEVADSISSRPNLMFAHLVSLSVNNQAYITYSIYRYLSDQSAENIRKINEDAAADPVHCFDSYKKLSANEMFMMLSYGFKETTLKNFQAMMEILVNKAGDKPISGTMIASMDKYKLKDFVIFCNKNKALDNVLRLADDDSRGYLINLANLPEKEDILPPFRNFSKPAAAVTSAEEENAKNVPKARPPKAVAEEVPVKTAAEPAVLAGAPQPEPVAVKNAELNREQVNKEPETPAEIQPEPLPVKRKKEETLAAAPAVASPLYSPAVVANNEMPAKVDNVPLPPPEIVVEPVKINLDERTKTILTLKKNIFQTIQNIPSFLNKDYAEEILTFAAEKEPDELFKKVNDFKGKVYCKHILELCAISAPLSAKRYLYNPQQPVNYILHYSDNSIVKKILEYNQHLGYYSRPLLLLDDLDKNRITLKEAIDISNDPNRLFGAVVKIISRPKYLGQYSIDHEMRDYSLRFIREINDKIASGAPQPFSSVENFNTADLYFLMLYGRDEVFSSTFNGLFDRFLQKLPNDDGNAFMASVNYNRFRDFISLCANYHNLEEFLSKFSPDAKNKLLKSYVANLETEQDQLSTIVLIAEGISSLTDNQLLTIIQQHIKSEYERVKAANNQIGLSIYGVLSSIISGNAKVDARWYRTISKQFQIAPATSLSASAFFGTSSMCTEQMYFYNDDDGRSSFISFINSYRNQPAWGVEDMNNFVRVYSKAGLKVEILANKPSAEENGFSAIAAYLQEKGVSPTVIVHRGHSFHTEATLEKVPSSAKLIFVGSCGGFYKIPIALENAPDAHYISTKQVGTKTVNDPILFALNEDIRTGKDIDWNDFWSKMRDKLGNNQYFSDYVPPHKNLEAIFIRAYYKVLGV